jgi:hypothetical protein
LLTPDPNPSEVESDIANLERFKSPGSDQILAELIQAGDETLRSEIHKLVNYIWDKEELPDLWNESVIVQICKKNDCQGILLLSALYKMLSNILLSGSPYIDEVIGDRKCGF